MRVPVTLLALGLILAILSCLSADSETALPPQFKGLAVGQATPDDVLRILGQPKHGGPAKDESVMYDSLKPGHLDTLTFEGSPPRLALVESPTAPPGMETRDAIRKTLGPPEYELTLGRQTMFEYTQQGYRFWFDNAGAVIGAVLFAPQEHPRVPAGEQRRTVVPPLPAPSKGKPAIFRVGFASRDITPPKEHLPDLGYEKIHDNLEVRAIVIVSGGRTIALVSGDIFVYTAYEIEPIRQAARSAGIDYLLFASTHSHSAPDCIGLDGPRPDNYNAFVQREAAACIEQAKQNLVPATIEVAQAELLLHGGRISTISRNWRDPGIVYPYLTVVRFISADKAKQPLASLVHFTCHPERLSRYDKAISADWVRPLRDTVESALGGKCIFFNGPLGGMVSPDGIPGADPFEDTQRIGEWIGRQAVEAVRAGSSPLTSNQVRFRRRPILVPLVSQNIMERSGPDRIRFKLIHGSHPTEVGRLAIGEMQILVVPGELLPDLAFRAQARMTGKFNVIIGLANDEIGYIVPEWDFRVGAYEERTGLGPSAAPQVMNAIAELLKR
jgi:hypothetical protein